MVISPVQSVPMPDNPFHKEFFPNIHHKPDPSQPITPLYPEPAFPDLSPSLHNNKFKK